MRSFSHQFIIHPPKHYNLDQTVISYPGQTRSVSYPITIYTRFFDPLRFLTTIYLTFCCQLICSDHWWVPASAVKAKAGVVQSVSGWTRGVQVKLWDPLRTRVIPERLRGVFPTRRYTRLPLPLPLPSSQTPRSATYTRLLQRPCFTGIQPIYFNVFLFLFLLFALFFPR